MSDANVRARRGWNANLSWALVLAGYLVIAGGWLWPQPFGEAPLLSSSATKLAFLARTLAFHLGLFGLLVAAVFCLTRNWRPLLVMTPGLLFLLLPEIWGFLPRSQAASGGSPQFKLMSYNLFVESQDFLGVQAEIRRHNPDILFLQEYSIPWDVDLQYLLRPEYPYRLTLPKKGPFGIAVYSRIPLKFETLSLGLTDNPVIRCEWTQDGQTAVLYNVHLAPPMAFERSREEFAELLPHLKQESHPVLLAGDWNFTFRSPQAAELRGQNLRLAHDLAGWGRGVTWNPNLPVPGLRIDHVFISPEWNCHSCEVGDGHGSDHHPVIVEMSLPAMAPPATAELPQEKK